MTDNSTKTLWLKWGGLIAGPLMCWLTVMLLPQQFVNADGVSTSFTWAGRATLGAMIWMGVWWLTEAVEISVTALLPIPLFPLMGVASPQAACFPYADPLIFLYFGGFVIALSMERWGLGRRIALLTLGAVGTSAPAMIMGFMVVTAGLSAFVSNTATTAMMLPIALSVIGLVNQSTLSSSMSSSSAAQIPQAAVDRFASCLLLAIAYSASVGGAMTIIGTPTNTFLIGFVREQIASEYRQDISFAGWLPIGVSFAVIFLPLMYWILTRFILPIQGVRLEGGKAMIDAELQSIGKMTIGEWNTLIVFLITVALWLFRPFLTGLEFEWWGDDYRPLANLSDTVIAMSSAMVLFLLPVNFSRRTFTMDWEHAARMPWGILFLFGGGLSLAAAVQANGVAEFLGSQTGTFSDLSPLLLVFVVTSGITLLTELTSNAATTASLVPVLAALAPGLGVHPYVLIFPATIAASCAFMLPVATPPNAIVFGSGRISMAQMARAGMALNVVAVFLVTALTWFVIKPWLGV